MKPFIQVAVLTPAGFSQSFFTYSNQPQISLGQLLQVPFGKKKLLGVVIGFADHSDFQAKAPLQIFPQILPLPLVKSILREADHLLDFPSSLFRAALPKFIRDFKFPDLGEPMIQIADPFFTPKSPQQKILWHHLSENNPAPKAALLSLVSSAVLKNLLSQKALSEFQTFPTLPPFHPPTLHKLTSDQTSALSQIKKSSLPILLHGVTGSGKTEIFLHLTSEMLTKNKSVIILVPEISLTPQLTSRFQEHFQEHLAVFHSRLSDGERAKIWSQLQSGLKKIVIGPRSAIFAPLSDLGLIILDEYHDDSFKQDQKPFYDARHFAENLARESNAILIFASATPRVQDFFFAA